MINDLPNSSDETEQEAAEWIVRLDAGLSKDEEAEYENWLSQDPARSAVIKKFGNAWSRFDVLETDEEREVLEQPVSESETTADSSKTVVFYRRITTIAAVLAVGLGSWGLIEFLGTSDSGVQEASFHANAYESRILSDGTILELNDGTRVDVELTSSLRRVWLHEGEVFFDVAKDASRPFLVHVGETEVRVLGTSFNIKHDDQFVQVAVTEGSVRFSQTSSSDPEDLESDLFVEQMTTGQVSTYEVSGQEESVVVETFDSMQMEEILAWKPEVLEFTSTPLRDVVTAFNARNSTQIVLRNEDLEGMPIEATFRSDNVMAFVRLLELTFDLETEEIAENKIYIGKSN